MVAKKDPNLRTRGWWKNTHCCLGCECQGCNNLPDKVTDDPNVSADDKVPSDPEVISLDDLFHEI